MTLVRILFLIVLISLSAAALLGVMTLVMNASPNIQILLSMFSVALFSLTALGCGFALERRQWPSLMILGLILSAWSLALYLGVIWIDAIDEVLGHEEERFMTPLTIWSIAVPMLGLQALTRFDNLLSLVRKATLVLTTIAAAMLSFGILAEMREDIWWRWTASMCILALLGCVANPVLYRIAGARRAQPETVRPELTLICPRCQLSQTVKTGESRCARCRLRFNIEMEEPRCPNCSYLLYNLTTPRCPECGHDLAPGEVVAAASPPPLPSPATPES